MFKQCLRVKYLSDAELQVAKDIWQLSTSREGHLCLNDRHYRQSSSSSSSSSSSLSSTYADPDRVVIETP